MTLEFVSAYILVSIILGIIHPGKLRNLLLLCISSLTIYILQPPLPIRNLGFWLSSLTLSLAIIGWILVTPKEKRGWRDNWAAGFIVGLVVIGVGLTRYLNVSFFSIHTSPPSITQIIIVIAVFTCLAYLGIKLFSEQKTILILAISLLIMIFILLKTPQLTEWISKSLRIVTGQSTKLASYLDIRWLGFSYIAFRLIHTLRDQSTGRLPMVSLDEYIIYIIFYPSIAAGPIDRLERFVENYRNPGTMSSGRLLIAGKRIVLGIFKKFACADTLAILALNTNNALQVTSTGWAWFMVYAFAFQIYFDFSGYTDIAIGMGELLGITLPENFNKPYIKTNLTAFWNSWHMTLTQWFRSYYFNPLTRFLRSGKKAVSIPLIIMVTQISTMILIGLWHGVTWNFLLWGLWHGMGLFIQNRWSSHFGKRVLSFPNKVQKILNIAGGFVTINFVAIGWVFFMLGTPQSSINIITKLFGIA